LLSQRREQKKKKRKPGELAEDEPIANADMDYKIKIHNVILDTVVESIHRRYAANAALCADVSCMKPKHFPEIREKGLPKTAIEELSEHATVEALQAELMHNGGKD
jgi:hypothetical protein